MMISLAIFRCFQFFNVDRNNIEETKYCLGEDPNFNDPGDELNSEGDDNLYEHNIIDGIEVGLNVGELDGMNKHDVEVDAYC